MVNKSRLALAILRLHRYGFVHGKHYHTFIDKSRAFVRYLLAISFQKNFMFFKLLPQFLPFLGSEN